MLEALQDSHNTIDLQKNLEGDSSGGWILDIIKMVRNTLGKIYSCKRVADCFKTILTGANKRRTN